MIKNITSLTRIKTIILLIVLVITGIAVSGSSYASARTVRDQDTTPALNLERLSSNDFKLITEDASTGLAFGVAKPSINSSTATTTTTKAPVKEEIPEDVFVYCPDIPLTEALQQFTYERSEEKGLDYSIVLGLMWRESTFNQNAIGYNSNGTRDRGIMQINDVNVGWLTRELNLTNLMDPHQNIIAGTEMLSRLVDDYGLNNGLLAYQHGEQGMLNKVRRGVTTDYQVEIVYTKSAEFDLIIDNTRATLI